MIASLLLLLLQQAAPPTAPPTAPVAEPVAQPVAQPVQTSGGPLTATEAAYDVLHYDLALEVRPAERTIDGRSTMTARALEPASTIELDLDGSLTVAAVTSEHGPLRFAHANGRVRIDFAEPLRAGERFAVAVDYGGAPRVAPRPPWEGGFTWSHTADGSPWIATTCQGEGADLWWPCKDQPGDEPESMDLFITIPAGLFCASNGVLVSDETAGDRRTQHWHVASPINNYSVALNIAPYVALETTFDSVGGESVPVTFWVLPEDVEPGRALLPQFLEHLAFLEELCGPYPFRAEKYGVVETPHLGMEHQTIIAYGNHFRPGPQGFDWLHHHELSHEWWGNLVTCRDWKDMWLHEGFATYMQALYVERLHGPAALRDAMARKAAGLANRLPVAPRETRDTKAIYFADRDGRDSDLYDKGAWALHTLRWLIGDEAFFAALRRMAYPDPALERVTDGSQTRFADTDDFRILAEACAKRDLDWFFEVYLRQPALPRLETRREGSELVLRWVPPFETAFPMPVGLRVGDELRRIEMPDAGEQRVEIGDAEFEIDPGGWLLRE